jgi:putative glycosyltransferase (TIGR04372 family)
MKSAIQSYIMRQYNQISVEGWPALWYKLRRFIMLSLVPLLILLAITLVLLIRLIRPLIIVRIGFSDVSRIGGIYPIDWYLSEKADGHHQSKYLDIFYFEKSTSHVNSQWLKMWRRVIHLVPGSYLWQNVLRLNKLIPGYEMHEIPDFYIYPISNRQLIPVLKNNKPNIFFTEEEKIIGKNSLQSIGITDKQPYVCFHSRDSAFLDAAYNKRDWSYHNYRDCSIQNYVLAAEEMANRGYYAVRMGSIVKDPIHCSNPHVIDYSNNGQRTDFNDIYIGSNCRFFISSDSGISIIPELFRIPVVYVNKTLVNVIHTWTLNGLFIFKKFYHKSKNCYISFSEIMNLEFSGTDTNEIFTKLNLELIENTPEEIRAVTIEMDERLIGTWETTEEDEELQQRFWALFGPDKLKSPDLRIGAEYLRQNKNLLK